MLYNVFAVFAYVIQNIRIISIKNSFFVGLVPFYFLFASDFNVLWMMTLCL